jgi:DNA ligase-1
MPPYIEIAKTLEAVSREERRGDKAEVVASLLKSLPPEMLRPVVRLLSGRLWPPWESREMGIGPETLGGVLEELSDQGRTPEAKLADMGDLAEMMVQKRSQQTLTPSAMDALQVYDALRQISAQKGRGSLFRKKSLLKGLFLNASPIEAKYITRTVLGRMMVGLGPSLMSAAIGVAFSADEALVKRAYSFLPDFGMVALNAFRGEIFEVELAPPNPVRLMLFGREMRPREAIERAGLAAYVVRYGGLRVQVHKFNDQVFIYSSRLRNVTLSLQDLAEEVMRAKGNFVMVGEFLLVHQGRILPRSEMVGRINLKGRSRDSAIPSFAASDLLYLNGEGLVDKSYAERRQLLSRTLKGVAGKPLYAKVFLAEELVSDDPEKAKDLLKMSLDQGFRGLVLRDLGGSYAPGSRSRWDVVISQMPDS